MQHKIYNVIKGQILADIATLSGLTINEIRDYHNLYSPNAIDNIPFELQTYNDVVYLPEETQIISENKVENILNTVKFDGEARYRCQQTVITKLNGTIQNSIDTKREFLVKKIKINNRHYFSIKMIENIIESNQTALGEAMKLICEIDIIKSSVFVEINMNTGKIHKILNYNEIINDWNSKKENIKNEYSYLRSSESETNFLNFFKTSENQFDTEEKLINDLYSKLFFDVFFESYLVGKNHFEEFSRNYYSQLFDGYKTTLNFRQDILSETPNSVEVRKVGELDKNQLDELELEKKYDEKFKSLIKYKYSVFNYSLRERILLDTKNNWINETNISILEEVKNNIQILINYNLKKIE